jgi:hypothetical protein
VQAAALSFGGSGFVVEPDPEPAGFDVDAAVWDVGWLDDLRDVPADGWWPRLMTVPHHRAVGSIGDEFVDWVRAELGVRLRWWQQLVARRMLEVDADGVLVWSWILLSVSRQCGKSWLVWALCEWRSEQATRFGEPQLVLHCADTLAHAKAIWQRAWPRAEGHGWPIRKAAGEYGTTKDDGEWLVRSQTAVFGYTASFGVADECQAVKVITIDQGLAPTIVEAAQSQILLVSTAHSESTELFPVRRAGALARLADPDNELLMEWSAPRGASVLDEVARRQASPHWHRKRADEIRAQAERAAVYEGQPYDHELVVGHRAQWHNEWRREGVALGKGVPLLDVDRWEHARTDADTVGPLVIGVEDWHGEGAAVAFCGQTDAGRFVLGGQLLGSRVEAYTLVELAARSRPGSTLVVGASLFADAELLAIPVFQVRKAGHAETGHALSMLREILATGRLGWDGSVELDGQARAARVTVGSSGIALVVGPRSDLLRAAVWALRVAAVAPILVPAVN